MFVSVRSLLKGLRCGDSSIVGKTDKRKLSVRKTGNTYP